MAYYLVRATPRTERMDDLAAKLSAGAFEDMQPFGRALTKGLQGARLLPDGRAAWEEEDYCSPPLAMEREAVLDHYFSEIEVEKVSEDEGWTSIDDMPPLIARRDD